MLMAPNGLSSNQKYLTEVIGEPLKSDRMFTSNPMFFLDLPIDILDPDDQKESVFFLMFDG